MVSNFENFRNYYLSNWVPAIACVELHLFWFLCSQKDLVKIKDANFVLLKTILNITKLELLCFVIYLAFLVYKIMLMLILMKRAITVSMMTTMTMQHFLMFSWRGGVEFSNFSEKEGSEFSIKRGLLWKRGITD